MMDSKDVFQVLTEGRTEQELRPKMSGFARYIGKSGGILVRAYGEADIEKQKYLIRRFPDIEKIWKMCCKNIKQGFCRVVTGAYLMGLNAEEIKQMCKENNIWEE